MRCVCPSLTAMALDGALLISSVAFTRLVLHTYWLVGPSEWQPEGMLDGHKAPEQALLLS